MQDNLPRLALPRKRRARHAFSCRGEAHEAPQGGFWGGLKRSKIGRNADGTELFLQTGCRRCILQPASRERFANKSTIAPGQSGFQVICKKGRDGEELAGGNGFQVTLKLDPWETGEEKKAGSLAPDGSGSGTHIPMWGEGRRVCPALPSTPRLEGESRDCGRDLEAKGLCCASRFCGPGPGLQGTDWVPPSLSSTRTIPFRLGLASFQLSAPIPGVLSAARRCHLPPQVSAS